MKIIVNGAEREVEPGASVATVIAVVAGDREGRGVAVAVNDEVVPRERWAELVLHDGDVVEALTAVPGG